jgi:ABC-type enterochelin transport system permease subunit
VKILSAFVLQHAAHTARQKGKNMIANAVFVATLIFLALGFWLMSQMHFLVPWRSLIVHAYLQPIATYCALLFANILGLTIWIERKFFLRDTGRKLRHLDREIHTGQSELSEEILSRFGEEEEER